MISFSSVIFTLFFYGIGGWFFYHNVAKKLPERIKAKRMFNRILNPDLKSINIEISNYATIVRNETNPKTKSIFNNQLYLKIIVRDITLLTSILKKEKNKDKRNIISRTLVLQLYEFYQDINNLYDKKFENEIVQLLSTEMRTTLKSIKKMNSMGGSEYFKQLQLIRMNVIGHRDFDTIKQLNLINDIDPDEIIKISNFALFMIYFFFAFHASFIGKILINMNQKIPDIPMFNDFQRDYKLWMLYVDYVNKKAV